MKNEKIFYQFGNFLFQFGNNSVIIKFKKVRKDDIFGYICTKNKTIKGR